MSNVQHLDLTTLRLRLQRALDHKQDAGLDGRGSLYLRALASVYLACDEDSLEEEATLEKLFIEQCSTEDVDADELLTEICLIQGGS